MKAQDACATVIDRFGCYREADVRWMDGKIIRWELGGACAPARPFVVDALPVEIHCHGVSHFDFSSLAPGDLDAVEASLDVEGIYCVPSVFVPRHRLHEAEALLYAFSSRAERFPHILGFAFEGPLIGSSGGTPETGAWAPSEAEWRTIAGFGTLGLRYIVMSPDAFDDDASPSLEASVGLLAAEGVAVALGHFARDAPDRSAASVHRVLASLPRMDGATSLVYTDHLYNDMPLRFRHAWRSPADRQTRDRDVAVLDLGSWNLLNIESRAGPVPGALITAAARGELTLFLNFDGEHVDRDVARRTVEMVGDACVIAMTDRLEVTHMADLPLESRVGSALWYQRSGIVAAGSTSIDTQRERLLGLGLDDRSAWRITALNALNLLAAPPRFACFVDQHGGRQVIQHPV